MTANNYLKYFSMIKDSIQKAESILITSHTAPDGDSLGSQLTMYKFIKSLGKKAVIINQENIPDMYQFLPNISLIQDVKKCQDGDRFDLVVIPDCSDIGRIGEVSAYINDKTDIINIDHHPDNTNFGDINLVNSTASSVGEILAEMFIEAGLEIDKETAELLYTAILTDTGQFRFEATGRRTMEIAGHLIEAGANPRYITDRVYYSQPLSIFRLTGELVSKAEFYENDRICLIILHQEALERFGVTVNDLEGLAENTMHGRNVIVGALLKEFEDSQVKVSLRSRNGINVSEVAHKFGGGGHFNASGFTIRASIETAREKLLSELRGLVNDAV